MVKSLLKRTVHSYKILVNGAQNLQLGVIKDSMWFGIVAG